VCIYIHVYTYWASTHLLTPILTFTAQVIPGLGFAIDMLGLCLVGVAFTSSNAGARSLSSRSVSEPSERSIYGAPMYGVSVYLAPIEVEEGDGVTNTTTKNNKNIKNNEMKSAGGRPTGRMPDPQWLARRRSAQTAPLV